MEIYCVQEVEQNPLPKSQTKPFYIGTKEVPSSIALLVLLLSILYKGHIGGRLFFVVFFFV